jgi:hypothetical protein
VQQAREATHLTGSPQLLLTLRLALQVPAAVRQARCR